MIEETGEPPAGTFDEAFYREVDRAMEADKAADGPFKRKFARGLELEQRQQDVQDVINGR